MVLCLLAALLGAVAGLLGLAYRVGRGAAGGGMVVEEWEDVTVNASSLP